MPLLSGIQGSPITIALAALKERDLHTFAHSDRTSGLAVELGRSCGLSRDELEILTLASVLHDIGKIGIPDSVLLKPGSLTEAEWDIVKSHPLRGFSILQSAHLKKFEPVAAVIRGHHENFAGNGYPDRMAGEDIPVMSRIVALADSYDAMAETRPYHPPRSHQAIMKIMNNENGNKFDPYLFDKFARIIEGSRYKSPNED